jgi:integrase
MTLVRNADGVWEADCRNGPLPRIHLSLGTKVRAKAEPLHAALVEFRAEGNAALDALLRRRDKKAGGITVQQLARCVRERKPFASLLPALAWPTVQAAADAYVDWLTGHDEREASTATSARQKLAPFVAAFGALPLDAVDPAAADQWQTDLSAARAVNTARDMVTRVVSMYAWHARQDVRAAATVGRPARHLVCPLDPERRPTRVVRRERFLTREEATRLIAATPDAILAHTGCLLLAGLRIDEMCHLRPDVDVDLARDMLVIQARGEKGQPGYWRPKGGKRREVPITADLRALLERQIAARASESYVFPSRTRGDRPLHPSKYRDAFEPCVTAAGLVYGREDPAGVVPHTLRHTFASWLVTADVNPYRVAKLMGNSLKMIEDTYGHLAPTDNRAAVALLSGAVPLPTFED